MTANHNETGNHRMLTVPEAARELGVGRRVVYNLIEMGALDATRSRGAILIERNSIDAFRASGQLT